MRSLAHLFRQALSDNRAISYQPWVVFESYSGHLPSASTSSPPSSSIDVAELVLPSAVGDAIPQLGSHGHCASLAFLALAPVPIAVRNKLLAANLFSITLPRFQQQIRLHAPGWMLRRWKSKMQAGHRFLVLSPLYYEFTHNSDSYLLCKLRRFFSSFRLMPIFTCVLNSTYDMVRALFSVRRIII